MIEVNKKNRTIVVSLYDCGGFNNKPNAIFLWVKVIAIVSLKAGNILKAEENFRLRR